MCRSLPRRAARLLHESSFALCLAWRRLRSLKVCVVMAAAGSNWDPINSILALKRISNQQEKRIPLLQSRQIDFLFAVLAGAGVECAWDHGIPGTRRSHASDPWGNRLEFIESFALKSGEAGDNSAKRVDAFRWVHQQKSKPRLAHRAALGPSFGFYLNNPRADTRSSMHIRLNAPHNQGSRYKRLFG